MSKLSNRVENLAVSKTIEMAKLSRELKEQGHDVISLSLGEPDFDTPQHVKEAAKQAIDDNFTHYTPVPGFLDLREAIVHKLKRDNQLTFNPNQIVVSTGAKQSLANLMLSLLNPGDEVIIPAPYWVSYPEMVGVAEGKPVFIETDVENDFKITANQLDQAITSKTKMLLYSSPCNPTGSLYSKEELQALAKVLEKHPDIIIVSDEIYEHINFVGEHESIAQFDFLKDRVVIVNGLSKGFAMTGWRLGYIAAPEWIAKACDKIQGQFTSGTCAITQRAAISALSDNLEPTREMKKAFQKRRDLIVSLLQEVSGLKLNNPQGAFYVFPDVSSFFGKTDEAGNEIKTSGDLCNYILRTQYVALVTGEAFGSPNCLRISYATSEDNIKAAVSRIKTALSELK